MSRRIVQQAAAIAPQIGIVAANAIGGMRAGLHSPASARKLVRQAIDDLDWSAFTAASRQNKAKMFATNIVSRRFVVDDPGSGPRRFPKDAVLPPFRWNEPVLDGHDVCRVIDAAQLMRIMSDADRTRFENDGDIDFSGHPVGPSWPWTAQLGLLPASSRHLALPDKVALASNLVWFTQANPAFWDRVRATPADKWPETARDSLGLVHFPFNDEPVALFLLHLPGDAIQLVGHYRPSFADDPMHRRFMARSSSRAPSPAADWGQTADLCALEEGRLDFDGLPERVGLNIYRDDLRGAPIRFEFLGILDSRRGGDDEASCDASDASFAMSLA